MGGSSKAQSQNNFSPSAEAFMNMRTDVAKGLVPGISNLLMSVLSGDGKAATQPFMKGFVAPIEDATRRSVDEIVRSTPGGARQSVLIADAKRKGAMSRAQQSTDMHKQLLQMAMQLFGSQPAPTGTTKSQQEPTSFEFGPLSFSF